MKYIILLFVTVIACSTNHDIFAQNLKPCELFTLSDAEKIIGGKARQTEELTETKDTSKILRCSYTAIEKVNSHDSNLFFTLELARNEAAAKAIYSSLKKSNAGMPGLEDLQGLGDEAYFHTDGENFYFIIARKGSKLMRLKMNKIKEETPLSKFKEAAKSVIDNL